MTRILTYLRTSGITAALGVTAATGFGLALMLLLPCAVGVFR